MKSRLNRHKKPLPSLIFLNRNPEYTHQLHNSWVQTLLKFLKQYAIDPEDFVLHMQTQKPLSEKASGNSVDLAVLQNGQSSWAIIVEQSDLIIKNQVPPKTFRPGGNARLRTVEVKSPHYFAREASINEIASVSHAIQTGTAELSHSS